MEIIEVEKFEQMINSSVYYELGNKYYARCWNCGTPVEIDYHRTAADLHRDEIGEEVYFCGENCKNHYNAVEGTDF